MKNLAFGALLLGALAMPVAAQAASNTVVGVGTGAVAGAVVGGPIGAVVGAVVGGVVGSNSERARPRRVRRSRSVRARRQAATVRARPVNVAEREAARPAVTRTSAPARQPAVQPTTWQNPR